MTVNYYNILNLWINNNNNNNNYPLPKPSVSLGKRHRLTVDARQLVSYKSRKKIDNTRL